MKAFFTLISIATLTALMGCEEVATYPVSTEQCGPNDPVLSLDAPNCPTPAL